MQVATLRGAGACRRKACLGMPMRTSMVAIALAASRAAGGSAINEASHACDGLLSEGSPLRAMRHVLRR